MQTFRVNIHSIGVATIEAPTKAAAQRRAREADFDSYELRSPEAQITSLAADRPIATGMRPLAADNAVVFRSGRDRRRR